MSNRSKTHAPAQRVRASRLQGVGAMDSSEKKEKNKRLQVAMDEPLYKAGMELAKRSSRSMNGLLVFLLGEAVSKGIPGTPPVIEKGQ